MSSLTIASSALTLRLIPTPFPKPSQTQTEEKEHFKFKVVRKNPRFYMAGLSRVPDAMSAMLSAYSHILEHSQVQHVLDVREAAYKTKQYPCLGRFRFLELDLSNHPLYKTHVIPLLTATVPDSEEPPRLLDLGTCLGQDLRKLIYDGVSVSRVYGADIEPDFIEAGYELFRDRDRLPLDQFVCPADIFDRSSDSKLSFLHGKIDILHVTAVFHLFELERQKLVADRCLQLLKRDSRNQRALILGGQVGNVEAKESVAKDWRKRYQHNAESWQRMWQESIEKDEWKDKVKSIQVDVQMQERHIGMGAADVRQVDEGFRWIVWSVWVEFF